MQPHSETKFDKQEGASLWLTFSSQEVKNETPKALENSLTAKEGWHNALKEVDDSTIITLDDEHDGNF